MIAQKTQTCFLLFNSSIIDDTYSNSKQVFYNYHTKTYLNGVTRELVIHLYVYMNHYLTTKM